MTREEIICRLYDRFIKPTEKKRESFIGVEIEIPIVNLNNEAVDFSVVHKLTAVFLNEFNFTPTGFDEEGHVYSAVNRENGDVFSYDCSYNNMEFSFGKEKNLHVIHERFKLYYGFVQDFFKPYNYTHRKRQIQNAVQPPVVVLQILLHSHVLSPLSAVWHVFECVAGAARRGF